MGKNIRITIVPVPLFSDSLMIPCATYPIQIVVADNENRVRQAATLFREYASSLSFDLCFQNFEQELAELPGKYAAPHGTLLLAFRQDKPIGCIALRPWEGTRIGEMKRLYVQPAARGLGVGKKLVGALLDHARQIGYERVRLDTAPSMRKALKLYESLGFQRIDAYCQNPIHGTFYLELVL